MFYVITYNIHKKTECLDLSFALYLEAYMAQINFTSLPQKDHTTVGLLALQCTLEKKKK